MDSMGGGSQQKQASPSAPTCWRHQHSGITAGLSLFLVKGIVWKPIAGSQCWAIFLGSKYFGVKGCHG